MASRSGVRRRASERPHRWRRAGAAKRRLNAQLELFRGEAAAYRQSQVGNNCCQRIQHRPGLCQMAEPCEETSTEEVRHQTNGRRRLPLALVAGNGTQTRWVAAWRHADRGTFAVFIRQRQFALLPAGWMISSRSPTENSSLTSISARPQAA